MYDICRFVFQQTYMSGRIIIIGNGFDLAHGLKTSYRDLMEFIKQETNPQSENLKNWECGIVHHTFKGKQNPYIGFEYIPRINEYRFATCKKHQSLYFTELFSEYSRIEKWVDLEMLYFNLISAEYSADNYPTVLNTEFDYLKSLLEDYLTSQVENRIGNYDFLKDNILGKQSPTESRILGIVNFNYTTRLISNYLRDLYNKEAQLHKNFSLINIHGELNSKSNPIIFGYGDDNSEKYKLIQDVGDNNLLVNFKTFQYLRNMNYKNVLSLLEIENNIKVEIIGHSCGLSDKTLLKTIFEHPNVNKIEYRYHSNEKVYFENVYNMSRIFTDNSLMRKKVIDLENTRIIPQKEIVMMNKEEELLRSL